jgi:hypothetical protein
MVQFFRDSLFRAGESLRVGSGERLRQRSDCTSTLGRTAEKTIFNPLHYLALFEQKINALDQAAALEGWQLPEDFLELRREMEERLGKRGRREYVQVLRLLETFSLPKVAAAVRQVALPHHRLRRGEESVAVRYRATGTEAGSGELSASIVLRFLHHLFRSWRQ